MTDQNGHGIAESLPTGSWSEDDLWAYREFLSSRLAGWMVVLGTNRAVRLHTDLVQARPSFDRMKEALEAGSDVEDLWPEHLREIVRFQSRHIVPREINEPSSAQFGDRDVEGFLPFAVSNGLQN
ncbi:MAG TPA: hypothetical protein VGO22_17300 [Pseudorhizobium sp.]|nr:hypothetical protein [Pseudorhizobium sp.]